MYPLYTQNAIPLVVGRYTLNAHTLSFTLFLTLCTQRVVGPLVGFNVVITVGTGVGSSVGSGDG